MKRRKDPKDVDLSANFDLDPKDILAMQEHLSKLRSLIEHEPPKTDKTAWAQWFQETSALLTKNQALVNRVLLAGLYEDLDHDDPEDSVHFLWKIFSQYSPRVRSRPAKSMDFPLDKINANVWTLLEEEKARGQLAFATEKRGSAKEATVIYSIDFDKLKDEVSITKKLTPFDKRCYMAVSALYNSGNGVISPAQIYTAMGNKGRPGVKDLEKVNESLTKMGSAHIYINNEQELAVNKKYERFVYNAALLPFERMSAYINNTLCETAIHLFREPPLTSFAKGRGQITTIPRELLESPVSKTDQNLRLDDYLIERIAHMKQGNARNKLLYDTIYKHCGITDTKQRQRAPEKIKRYLEHYKACGFIAGYREMPDGILIELDNAKRI